MSYSDWLKSFLRNLPKVSYMKIRNSVLLKNYNDINWYFIYYIILMLGKYIKKIKLSRGEYHIYLKDYNDLEKVLYFIKYNMICQFKILIDICGVDFIQNSKNRFEINYNLLSVKYWSRLHIKINVNEFIAVPSIIKIFKSANWYEREVWDMFGIFFKNHNDLRRILTDYGFEGFPLRKDFPQTGYIELRYNNDYKHLIYEPLELSQDFRNFDFISPWNQIK
jgi:NADH dehydrogenase (ubiquinone) Fe-S protein 3